MKIYISSKITENENYLKDFEAAETFLDALGHEVINPCKLPHDHGKSYAEYMKEDIKVLLDCDGIYMFGDWFKSEGAVMERAVARICGLQCMYERRENQ